MLPNPSRSAAVLLITATLACGCQSIAQPPPASTAATTRPAPAADAPYPIGDAIRLAVALPLTPFVLGLMVIDGLTGRHIFPKC